MEDEELARKIETLQHMMVDRATGGHVDDAEYKELRRQVISNAKVKEEIPRFLHTCRSIRHFWSFIKQEFETYEERRKFIWSDFAPSLNKLEGAYGNPSDEAISEALKSLDAGYVEEIWQKALDRRDSDPEGAVTAARTLLESVCKSILDEMGVTYNEKADLPKLYHETAEVLDLAPSQHSEKLFKKNLGQLPVSSWNFGGNQKCSQRRSWRWKGIL